MREKRWGSFFQDKVTGEAKIECDELVQRLQEKGIANPLVERSRCICRQMKHAMSDDKTKRGPADASRIDIHEDYEVTYWCGALGCTREQLIAAVRAVGVMVADVRRYLGK